MTKITDGAGVDIFLISNLFIVEFDLIMLDVMLILFQFNMRMKDFYGL